MAFAQPFQDAFDAGRTLAPAAVGTQVLIMSAFSLVTLVFFNFLRPRNKIVYEPKVKYHVDDKSPPRIGDTFCGWLPPLIHTKEPELLDKIGLDAVAFLRFLRLMRGIFMGTAILACGILIPINFLYNRAHIKPKKRDALSMLTIRDVRGNSIYAHVAVSYLITLLVLGFIYIHGQAMVKLRTQWFKSPEYMKSFYARTLSITNVPKKLQRDGGLNEILGKSLPYPITSVHMARAVGDLPKLIEYHNQTVRDFEAVLVKYLRGGIHHKSRPVVTFGGIFGIGAVCKDAIEFYTNKLKRTEAAVEEYRSKVDTRKPENYGFASLAAVPYAHVIAKHLATKHPRGATVTLAPNPKDIIWSNMTRSRRSIACTRLTGCAYLSIICFFSLIPLFFVAALANLDSVTAAGYIPFLDSWYGDSQITFAIVSGVVPPAVSGLFTVFLPRIMRWLGRYQGALTHARLDRAVVGRYWAFLVISQLIVFTLIGVVFNSVTEIVALIGKHASTKAILANLDKLPGRIPRTYINTSTYWLKFFPLRGFLVVFDLAQIINLLWISLKTRVFGRTPRDIREWTQPPKFEYAIYYSNLLFMATVGLIFAPLVPLVALAAAIVFWISSWVYKYQLMFVFVTKVETGGRLWNVVINRILCSLFLMQCLMILTIGLQISFRSAKMVIAVPPILMIIVFKIYMNRKFNKSFYYYLPNEEELRTALVHSMRGDTMKQRLQHRFGHPSLHADLFTPMVHADQMQLLQQVYGGKIDEKSAENKARDLDVEVFGGLRIAAIQQSDLQYDPVLYSRDRGEYDNDRYSLASSSMLSPTSVSYYKGNSGVHPSLPYAPQSYTGSDADSGMLRPQSMLSTSSGDQRSPGGWSGGISPPLQTYFDPRLSLAPVHAEQRQSMHSRDSSLLPRPMSTVEHHHHSLSVYSQDSAPRRTSQRQSLPAPTHSPQSSPPSQLAMLPHPRHSMVPQDMAPPTFHPRRESTGTGHSGNPPQEWSPQTLIEEVPRSHEPQVVFQFGAPTHPASPGASVYPAPATPEGSAQMPFVEPRFDHQY